MGHSWRWTLAASWDGTSYDVCELHELYYHGHLSAFLLPSCSRRVRLSSRIGIRFSSRVAANFYRHCHCSVQGVPCGMRRNHKLGLGANQWCEPTEALIRSHQEARCCLSEAPGRAPQPPRRPGGRHGQSAHSQCPPCHCVVAPWSAHKS